MKKLILPALAAVTLASGLFAARPALPAQGASFDHTHAGLTAVYEGSVRKGLVDYAGLRKSPAALDKYLGGLAATTPAQHAKWSRDERFAFWINAYNAYTIQLIRDRGPVKSIKKLGGLFSTPWKIKFIPLNGFDPEKDGEKISLDEIEHELIRPVFRDARVHAAVNCASMGCPPLRPEAFTAEKLDDQLAEQVSVWLRDQTRNQATPSKGKMRVSKIFDWFKEDFGKSDANVASWIAEHIGDEKASAAIRAEGSSVDIKYLSYDWDINAQEGKR